MDPMTIAAVLGKALASAAAGAAVQQAMPKYGMTQPGQPPGMQGMDFNSLVQQQGQQSNLPKLQLQNRLPRY